MSMNMEAMCSTDTKLKTREMCFGADQLPGKLLFCEVCRPGPVNDNKLSHILYVLTLVRKLPTHKSEIQIIAGLDEFPSFLFLMVSQQTQNDFQNRVKFGSGFRSKAKPRRTDRKHCWEM